MAALPCDLKSRASCGAVLILAVCEFLPRHSKLGSPVEEADESDNAKLRSERQFGVQLREAVRTQRGRKRETGKHVSSNEGSEGLEGVPSRRCCDGDRHGSAVAGPELLSVRQQCAMPFAATPDSALFRASSIPNSKEPLLGPATAFLRLSYPKLRDEQHLCSV